MDSPDIEAEAAEDQGSDHKTHLSVKGVSGIDDVATTDRFVVDDAVEELGAEDNVQGDRSCNAVSVLVGHPIRR